MATCLSMLTSLKTLQLEFKSPQSCPDQENRRPPPPTRSILPALTCFWFKGVNEYLEDLVARIDTPRLPEFSATFFNDIEFDTPELIRFVSRTPTFEAPIEARAVFGSLSAWVRRRSQASYLEIEIICRVPNWQLSSLAQICTSSLPLLSTTENLYIHEDSQSQLDWRDDIENTEWLELLLPFTAVKDLYLSKVFAPGIAAALQELVGARITEVLPNLRNIFVKDLEPSGPFRQNIGEFVAARQLSDHPIAISVWE